jgi:glycosyltransferase involved in cell wall biosynthesis
MQDVYLSVIIPCYNESGNIKRGVLADVSKYMETKDFSWEVVISDDGSSDSSVALAKEQTKSCSRWKTRRSLERNKSSTR